MPARRLPVRPDLDHLRHQAKDLLRAIHRGEPEALHDLQEFHPKPPEPAEAKLADAQLALARSYDAASWPRLGRRPLFDRPHSATRGANRRVAVHAGPGRRGGHLHQARNRRSWNEAPGAPLTPHQSCLRTD
jgi:hypothetical protein